MRLLSRRDTDRRTPTKDHAAQSLLIGTNHIPYRELILRWRMDGRVYRLKLDTSEIRVLKTLIDRTLADA